jgi:hypothetical protein
VRVHVSVCEEGLGVGDSIIQYSVSDRDQVSRMYKTTGKAAVPYILIFV